MATRDETRRQFSPANVPEYLNQVRQTGRRWVLLDCRVPPCGVLLLFLSPSPHLLVVSVMLDLLERDRETDRSTFPPTSHISSHLSQSRQTPNLVWADTSLTPLYRLIIAIPLLSITHPLPTAIQAGSLLLLLARVSSSASPPDTWHLLIRLQQSLLLPSQLLFPPTWACRS